MVLINITNSKSKKYQNLSLLHTTSLKYFQIPQSKTLILKIKLKINLCLRKLIKQFNESYLNSKKVPQKNAIEVSTVKNKVQSLLSFQMIHRKWESSLWVGACILLVLSINAQNIDPSGCIEFANQTCTRCSEETHLYQGYCYRNIIGCKRYSNGAACLSCDVNITKLVGNTCQLLSGLGSMSQILKEKLYIYGNPGDNYGGNDYIPIAYSEVKDWPTFKAMDVNIRNGEYSHFISRSSTPVYSVHYSINGTTYGYKVLYEGTGGGLFLCITQVSEALRVSIFSLTTISLTYLIENCIDYDQITSKCIRCGKDFHLQGQKCYQNYGGCIKYIQNICLQCNPNHLLIQNRCVSDCTSISDSRSVLFYEAGMKSSFQTFYQVSLTTFYKINQRQVSTTTSSYMVRTSAPIATIGYLGQIFQQGNTGNFNQITTNQGSNGMTLSDLTQMISGGNGYLTQDSRGGGGMIQLPLTQGQTQIYTYNTNSSSMLDPKLFGNL